MKIKAFIQCRNDLERLDFVLHHFKKHHPDIHVFVANDNGKDPENIVKKYSNCSFKNYDYRTINYDEKANLPDHLKGSFLGYKAIERIFDYAFNDLDFTHLLFLETDVLTKKKIIVEPKFDVSGFFNLSANHVNEAAYELYNLEQLGVKKDSINTSWGNFSFMHTGCGGTIYTKKFFLNSYGNLPKIKFVDENYPFVGHIDLQMTILGMISDCSIGLWDDVTQRNTIGRFNKNAALEHNVKLISKIEDCFIISFGDKKQVFESEKEIVEY